MIKNLVIVESPAKAKTIEKYLGKDFKVTSSMGHIRDLVKGDNAIDIENGFVPKYEVSEDKKNLVKELKKLTEQSEIIWLATDEDREGEAISWHLYETLKLKPQNTKRIVFNEITKSAILRAIENPRTIDNYLVDAQQARRILDRLVGFELSPVLWKKVKPQLSAGRVQSVAVRLIVEREREINEFKSQSEFKLSGEFLTNEKKILKATCNEKLKDKASAESFLNQLIDASFAVAKTETKPAYRNPAPPFTTSTLQQEASRKLGYDVTRTMMLAQRLYENGYISYMRTDSVSLSQEAIGGAKAAIESLFGSKYSNPKNYATKNENAQEAHEAIRPTNFTVTDGGDDPQQKKLYELIWKRSIASQMSRAELEKTVVTISNSNNQSNFIAEGEVIKFDGFLKVYIESQDEDDEEEKEGLLPKVHQGEILDASWIKATQKFSKPAARYTEASLVKKLEELGIGRPSTYAPTITTVQKRGYVVNESRDGKQRSFETLTLTNNQIKSIVASENYGFEKNKLFPTDIGTLVTDFLLNNFNEIMDYGFTASVEKEFDEIANGLKSWQKMLDGFYEPFHSMVENTTEKAERVTGERKLGIDPKTGRQVLVRIGRFGPLVQIGTKEDGADPQFASLQRSQSIETISLEEALKLFSLPRTIMEFNGLPVVAAIGRFGPYLKWNEKFYNVPKGTDLLAMTPAEAESLLTAALSAPQFPLELGEYEGEKLTVNKGRFGPFIKFKDLFCSIPKADTVDLTAISLQRAIEIVQAKQESERNKILREYDNNKDVRIIKGRYGAYIEFKKNNIAIPKGRNWEELTYDEVMDLVGNADIKEKASSKTTKKDTSKKVPAVKKAAAKKPVAKKK